MRLFVVDVVVVVVAVRIRPLRFLNYRLYTFF